MFIAPSRIVALQGRIPKAELGRLYNEECLSVIEIAQKFGVLDHEVVNLLTAYGILGRYNSRTQTNRPNSGRGRGKLQRQVSQEDLAKLYHEEGLSLEDIARKFGVTRTAVHHLLESYGIQTRSQSDARILAYVKGKFEGKSTADLRESLFSRWSQPMAYLLGYIFTDGRLTRLSPGTCRVTISSIDREHLEKLAAILGDGVKVETRTQSKRGFSGTEDRHIYSIGFTRPGMIDDLRRLGLTERKSLTMKFPDVPEGFLRDFMRGCWDGDGSIVLRDNYGYKHLRASFVCGSEVFIQGLRDRLNNRGFGRLTIYTRDSDGVKTKNRSYSLAMTATPAVKFCEFLYDNVPQELLLTRKFLIYKSVAPDLTRSAVVRKPSQTEPPSHLEPNATPSGGPSAKPRRCAAIRRNGTYCLSHARAGTLFCAHHQGHTGAVKPGGDAGAGAPRETPTTQGTSEEEAFHGGNP